MVLRRELVDDTAAILQQLLAVASPARTPGEEDAIEEGMDVDDAEADDDVRSYSSTPAPEHTPLRDHRPAPLKVVRASWTEPEDDEEDPGYNVRHSKMILRYFEANELMHGGPRALPASTSKIISRDAPTPPAPASVVPPARRRVTWADTTTTADEFSSKGPGSSKVSTHACFSSCPVLT